MPLGGRLLEGGEEFALCALALADAGGGVLGGLGGGPREKEAEAVEEIGAVFEGRGGVVEAGDGELGDEIEHLGFGSHAEWSWPWVLTG